MFTVEERERIRDLLVEKARTDPEVVAAAAVGGSAGEGDRWSDLDLTFGVADEVAVQAVLAEWTGTLVSQFGAALLFDLPAHSTIYRVFLLPGALQVDLSFTPASEFGALGPRFRLLFGEAVERIWPAPPSPDYLFGLGVHHVVRAHICIERGRLWQAEYWLHEARDQVLALACHRYGLNVYHGRGFDGLPSEVLDGLAEAFVAGITAPELRRALRAVSAGLLREAEGIAEAVTQVGSMLEELLHPASI